MMCDIQRCCRVCLSTECKLNSILKNDNVQLELATCLSIVVSDNDNFPKNICVKCTSELHQYYEFHLNARYSQDWLETAFRKQKKPKPIQSKELVQPLPDPEYNSDSLLEFLNNTENVDDYLSTLHSDLVFPSIVNLIEQQNDSSLELASKFGQNALKVTKITSTGNNPSHVNNDGTFEIHMEIDVLDSDEDIVKEILLKESNEIINLKDSGDSISKQSNEKCSPAIETYCCMACKSIFNSFDILSDHISTCEQALKTCFECDLQFENKQKLQKHKVLHRSIFEYVCESCGKKFINSDRLLQHNEKCHSDFVAGISSVYRCKECGEIFRNKNEIYKHAKNHVRKQLFTNDNYKFQCDICDEWFEKKNNLDNHKKIHHKISGVSTSCLYRCKVCLAIFKEKQKLYSHIKQHTAVLNKEQHLCESCGRSFNSMTALNKHVLIHVGDKHKCRHCMKEFIDDNTLSLHTLLHERKSGMCEFCGMTFMKLEFLQKHLKEHASSHAQQ